MILKAYLPLAKCYCQGKSEEITDADEQQQAMQGLIHRIMPSADQPSSHPSHGITEKKDDICTKVQPVVFKFRLTKKRDDLSTTKPSPILHNLHQLQCFLPPA